MIRYIDEFSLIQTYLPYIWPTNSETICDFVYFPKFDARYYNFRNFVFIIVFFGSKIWNNVYFSNSTRDLTILNCMFQVIFVRLVHFVDSADPKHSRLPSEFLECNGFC
jgi:hypothetical protein